MSTDPIELFLAEQISASKLLEVMCPQDVASGLAQVVDRLRKQKDWRTAALSDAHHTKGDLHAAISDLKSANRILRNGAWIGWGQNSRRTLIHAAVLLEEEARCLYRSHVSGRIWGYDAEDILAFRAYSDMRRTARLLRQMASMQKREV